MVPGLEVGHDKLDGEVLHRHRGKGRNLRIKPHHKGEGHIGKARVGPRASVAVVNDGVIRGLGHPTMPDGAREGACPVGVWPSRRRGRGGLSCRAWRESPHPDDRRADARPEDKGVKRLRDGGANGGAQESHPKYAIHNK